MVLKLAKSPFLAVVTVLAGAVVSALHPAAAIGQAPATTDAPAGAATTLNTKKEVTPDQAALRAKINVLNYLLDGLSDEQMYRLGRSYRFRKDYASAAIFELTALRGRPKDYMIEYDLACNFALWGQRPLAVDFLQNAARHGYWGYRIIVEDTDLDAIKKEPGYATALKKIKSAFATEAPKNAPGITLDVPTGDAPPTGWPVVVSLHGFGSSRHDFDSMAESAAAAGYVGITLDGTEVLGPDSYMWASKETGSTHTRVQQVLADLKVKIDPKRVFLQGFSQGAMHAVRLLADHPDLYAGAIVNSPGSAWLLPGDLADASRTGGLILSVGSAEGATMQAGVESLQTLWKSAGRAVRVIHFDGGHQTPPDFDELVPHELNELSAIAATDPDKR